MMLYCENCMTLVEDSRCPACKNKDLRVPLSDDPVLLLSRQSMWAEMAEDVLEQHGILVFKRGVLGAGIAAKLGSGLESFRLYVPLDKLAQARELMAELFPSDYHMPLSEEETKAQDKENS